MRVWNRGFRRYRLAIIALVLLVLGVMTWRSLFASQLRHERRWSAQPADVGPLLFSPDGKTLFAAAGGAISLWDADTGTLKSTLRTDALPMAIAPAGDILACVYIRRPDKRTQVYGMECWDLKRSVQLGAIDHVVTSAAFSPDGKTLATVTHPINGRSSTIELWSLPTLAPITTMPRPLPVAAITFSPNGKTLASSEGNRVELLDPKTGKSTRTFTAATSALVGPAQFLADGQTLAVIYSIQPSSAGAFCTFDLATGAQKLDVKLDHKIREARFSEDGRTLAVLLIWYRFSRSDRAEAWDTTTGRRIGKVTARDWMASIALSPDGRRLVIGYQQPRLRANASIDVWHVR